tara:strand:- start:1011 stop:1181 length:171 start_codon:yes stop_codon:yes gene_type:complete
MDIATSAPATPVLKQPIEQLILRPFILAPADAFAGMSTNFTLHRRRQPARFNLNQI